MRKSTSPLFKCIIILTTSLLLSCKKESGFIITSESNDTIDKEIASTPKDSLMVLIAKYEKEGNKYGCIKAYSQKGKEERHDGQFIKSIHSHEKALHYAETIKDTLDIINEHNNLGTTYRRLGKLENATTHHYQALNIYDSYTNRKDVIKNHYSPERNKILKSRVKALNGIGNICLTLHNYTTADSIFRLALKEEKLLNSDLGQAINYANIGAIFNDQNQLDSARYYYSLSLKHNEKANSKLGIALCHTYFGELYEKEYKWDKAILEHELSYNKLKDMSDSYHLLESCIALARTNFAKRDWVAAEKYTDEALAKAKVINSNEHLSKIFKLKYHLKKREKNYQEALSYFIKSTNAKEKVVNEKNRNRLFLIQQKYEREKRNEEIKLIKQNYELNKRTKNLILIFLLTLFTLSIALIALLLYSLKLRRKRQLSLLNLEQKRTSFFTNITHEFRTPLTMILGLAEQLKQYNYKDKEQILKASEIITRHGENLLLLINQLLDISKIKSEIGTSEKKFGDIIPFIRMISDNYKDAAISKNIEFAFIPESQHEEMVFIPEYIRKILSNLISNALKFTPEYGHIYIKTSSSNNLFNLTVSDTGIGIPANKLPFIFDLLYQTNTSHSQLGNGIGLSLVKQIVEAINGQINVESQVKHGTTFNISIPINKYDEEATEINEDFYHNTTSSFVKEYKDNATQEDQLPSGIKDDDSTYSILIVEDNIDVAYYIGSNLKHNYSLHYASNGIEGLDMANDVMPDLIITDIMMPEIDGIELCEKVRTSDILNHIPVIMITAKSSEEDRIKGINAGADAYLYKPFNTLELNVRVESILESRRLLRYKFSALKQENNNQMLHKEQQFLNKFIDIAYSMMGDGTIYIEDIASQMFMSSKQLNRKITSITGKSSSAYITEIRMAKAKRMLNSNTDLTIAEIGMKCGYEDNAYFSRIFKKTFNVTPTQYKNMKS